MGKRKFINSYNFVPFGYIVKEQRTSRESVYRGKNSLISGWLTVQLDTKTPVIIPDGAHPKYFDYKKNCEVPNPNEEEKKRLHKEYSFLRVPSSDGHNGSSSISGGSACDEAEPIIPGSELRGMIRSVYEAVTDSCVPFLMNDKPISQRVPTFGSLQRRGLLAYERISMESEQRHWVLYSTFADKQEVTINRDGHIFLVENGKRVHEKNGEYVEGKGWLQYNIPVNKKGYHIAYLNKNEEVFSWDYFDADGNPDKERNEEPYMAMKSVLYKNGKIDANWIPKQNLKNALERAKNGEDNLVPVYYFTVKRGEETLVYLSNSSVGRIAQRRKWKEIMGDYAPCDSTEKLCPACLLFGTVADKGMKGHIRITDAAMTSKPKWETHTLQILGEPRTSAFEFYLRKPKDTSATYWNFDFYGEKVYDKNGNAHTQYHDLGSSTPRGRKMYWHSSVAPDAEKGNMNATMEAVNGSFEFKVYFDEITEEQLQNLIWVITLGENEKNSTRQHKIGHGRPLGYGSIKMTVSKKVIRRLEVSDGEIQVVVDESPVDKKVQHKLKGTETVIENLLKMCDTTTIPADIPVMYPKEINKKGQEAIFTWFAENRKNADYVKTLPEPTDENLTLLGNWKNGTFTENTGNKSGYDVKKNSSNKNPSDKNPSEFIGTVQNGTVTHMNGSGKFVYLKLADGSKASAYANGKTYKRNDPLKVKIKKYDSNYASYSAEIVGN